MSPEEMRELRDSGMLDDTYFEKQDDNRTRKTGWKIMAIDPKTRRPYVMERGFATEQDAVRGIKEYPRGSRQGLFVKQAESTDEDYYHSGEKGFWSSMTPEESDYYEEALDHGYLY